jgi:hypothetical protein
MEISVKMALLVSFLLRESGPFGLYDFRDDQVRVRKKEIG